VLAETAELASEVDVKRAQKAKDEATKSGDKEVLKRFRVKTGNCCRLDTRYPIKGDLDV
jgi:hypothetical protein